MCRHFAYLGPPVPCTPCCSRRRTGSSRQSYEPRRQRHGLLNADGFGVGWYGDRVAGAGAVPPLGADLG